MSVSTGPTFLVISASNTGNWLSWFCSLLHNPLEFQQSSGFWFVSFGFNQKPARQNLWVAQWHWTSWFVLWPSFWTNTGILHRIAIDREHLCLRLIQAKFGSSWMHFSLSNNISRISEWQALMGFALIHLCHVIFEFLHVLLSVGSTAWSAAFQDTYC